MSSFNYHGKKYTAKDTADEETAVIPARYIPQIVYAIEQQKDIADWTTENEWLKGYTDLCNVQWSMLMGGLQDLIESNNRIYRLIDTAYNGVIYSASGDTPPIVTPPIPAAPADGIGELPGLRRQLLDSQGILPGGWFGVGAEPATTADLVMALRAGSDADIERVTSVLDVLVGAGSTASVFNAVRGLLTDTAQLGAEGGILAVLVASTMSQAALMGLQAGQLDTLATKLDRLIEQLGVAAAPAPEDTIAGELASTRDLLMPETLS
jgi:hypothetical protein